MMVSLAFWLALVATSSVTATHSMNLQEANSKLFQKVDGLGYYHVVNTPYSWSEANDYCKSLGSDLAVVDTEEEASALAALVRMHSPDNTHAFVSFSDVGGVIRCGGITSSGAVRDDCTETSSSICEIPIWRMEYTLVEGIGYYKTHSGLWTWPTARSMCLSDGGHLAIVNSREEYRAIQRVFNDQLPDKPTVSYDDFVWMGGHSETSELNYVTIFGDPISETGYDTWEENEPSNSPGYLGIKRNGQLSTEYAFTAYPPAYSVMCERELS